MSLVLIRPSAAAAWAMALAAGFAGAQTATLPPAIPSVDEGLRRQGERERAQQQSVASHADVLRPPAARGGIPDLPDERPCFAIAEIALVGPDAQRLPWLQRSTDVFLYRCIGAQGLALVAAYLDAQLIEQGYVTSRVSLAAQNLRGGRVEFQLHTGRIGRVRMVDADRAGRPDDERWGTWRNAFPTHDGALLDTRDLEQGVEQMKSLPSQSVTTTLTPGERPDTSIVTIERHAGPWGERVHGGFTLDNSGGPTLGRTQASASVSLDNPLGINDIVSLSANGNAERPRRDHRSQSLSLNYRVPFGYATVSANLAHSRFAQVVQLPTLPHLSSGSSDTAELRLQHVAWRTASARAALYASVATRQSRSYIDDTELTQQHRQTTFFETGISIRKLLAGNASVEAEFGMRRGVSWVRAQEDLPRDAADAADAASVPTLRPRIRTFSLAATLPFEQPAIDGAAARSWQYSATLRGQSTRDLTLSVDQMAIGGRATVRGFDGDSVLLAENGWALRHELATPLRIERFDASFYMGFDHGRVWGPSDANLPGHKLVGAALGMRTRAGSLQVDAALAVPITRPDGFKTRRLAAYASATQAF